MNMPTLLTTSQTAGEQYSSILLNILNSSIIEYRILYNILWNPKGYTTADLLTFWGVNAAANLTALANLASAITNAGGVLPPMSGAHTYTVNNDGTVTLTD